MAIAYNRQQLSVKHNIIHSLPSLSKLVTLENIQNKANKILVEVKSFVQQNLRKLQNGHKMYIFAASMLGQFTEIIQQELNQISIIFPGLLEQSLQQTQKIEVKDVKKKRIKKQTKQVKVEINSVKEQNILQRRMPTQIYICCCQKNYIFFDRLEYQKHFSNVHLKLFGVNNLYKCSHWYIFQSMLVNPFCKNTQLSAIYNLKLKLYQKFMICQCLTQNLNIQPPIYYHLKQYLKHINQYHQGKQTQNKNFSQVRKGQLKNQKSFLNKFSNEELEKLINKKLKSWRQNLFYPIPSRLTFYNNPYYLKSFIYQKVTQPFKYIIKCLGCNRFFQNKCLFDKSHKFCKNIDMKIIDYSKIEKNNQFYLQWINLIKSKQFKSPIIKCGCRNRTFSNFQNFKKHIKKSHKVNPHISSHILTENQQFIQNPKCPQSDIIQDIIIGNSKTFVCGYCPQIIFYNQSKYLSHIFYQHKSFHKYSSHYVGGITEGIQFTPQIILQMGFKQIKSQKIIQKRNQNINQLLQNIQLNRKKFLQKRIQIPLYLRTTFIQDQVFYCLLCKHSFNEEFSYIVHIYTKHMIVNSKSHSHIIFKKKRIKAFELDLVQNWHAFRMVPHEADKQKIFRCFEHNQSQFKYDQYVNHIKNFHKSIGYYELQPIIK